MPDSTFLWIFKRGMELGIVVLFLLPLRLVLRRKAPRIFCYMLWLVLPVSIVYMWLEKLCPNMPYAVVMLLHNAPVFVIRRTWFVLCKAVYLVGVGVQVAYLLYAYVRVYWSVLGSIRYQKNVYVCERIKAPFTFGLLHPVIYLPAELPTVYYEAIILHEQTHVARKDIWMKHIGIVLRVVFWFQPLLWIGFRLFESDIEAACDEAVVRNRDISFRRRYASALYYESVGKEKNECVAAGYNGGEVGRRIRFAVFYQKPGRAAKALAILACVLFVGVAVPLSWQIPQTVQVFHTDVVSVEHTHSLGITGMELPIEK